MLIIGCYYRLQVGRIAKLDTTTRELKVRRSDHENGEAQRFCSSLPKVPLGGIEATGRAQRFERLMAECGHELWVGDPAEIRARLVRKQKTDERDALHLLDLSTIHRIPRVRVLSPAERDARKLLQHREKLVRTQTALKSQLHGLVMGQGLCLQQNLWRGRNRPGYRFFAPKNHT